MGFVMLGILLGRGIVCWVECVRVLCVFVASAFVSLRSSPHSGFRSRVICIALGLELAWSSGLAEFGLSCGYSMLGFLSSWSSGLWVLAYRGWGPS